LTTTEVRATGTDPAPIAVPPAVRTRRWNRIAGACLVVAFGVTLSYVVGNETQANTQSDQSHQALSSTRHQIGVATRDLTEVRRNLATVDGQVTVDAATLSGDASNLAGAKSALVAAQADVARQASTEIALHGCLGGIEQALNALALGDQTRAINALTAVSASCKAAGVDIG
jgi:hypothetical protein